MAKLLSIIIPMYNEENTIAELLQRLQKIKINREIIVVDDASTDKSPEIVKKFNVSYYRLSKNSGKGSAVRFALKHVKGDVVIIQDADLEYDPSEYHKIVNPIFKGKEKVVYGNRVGKRKFNRFLIGNRFVTFLVNILYASKLNDLMTCYKAIDSKLLKSLDLKCERFEFCPEITAKLLKKNISIKEVPIKYNPRSAEEGKKIRWQDGVKISWTLLKERFT